MFGGVHHLGLTVRDPEASAAWYVEVPNSITGAAVLVFRDPDNIQLEPFFEPAGRGEPPPDG